MLTLWVKARFTVAPDTDISRDRNRFVLGVVYSEEQIFLGYLDEVFVEGLWLCQQPAKNEVLLRKVFIERVRHATKCKEVVVFERGLLGVHHYGPHARELGEFLALLKLVRYSLNSVIVLWVARQLR